MTNDERMAFRNNSCQEALYRRRCLFTLNKTKSQKFTVFFFFNSRLNDSTITRSSHRMRCIVGRRTNAVKFEIEVNDVVCRLVEQENLFGEIPLRALLSASMAGCTTRPTLLVLESAEADGTRPKCTPGDIYLNVESMPTTVQYVCLRWPLVRPIDFPPLRLIRKYVKI